MSYSEKDGQVVLTMSREDYETFYQDVDRAVRSRKHTQDWYDAESLRAELKQTKFEHQLRTHKFERDHQLGIPPCKLPTNICDQIMELYRFPAPVRRETMTEPGQQKGRWMIWLLEKYAGFAMWAGEVWRRVRG